MIESFKNSDSGQMIQSWFNDVVSSWIIIVLSTVTAVLLGYVYLIIISCIGGVIIWLCIWIIILGLAGLTGYCFYYREETYQPDEDKYKYMTWAGYGIGGFAVLVCILVCCCYRAIKIGIAVFKTTSQ